MKSLRGVSKEEIKKMMRKRIKVSKEKEEG
jgi:hypothetical protein